MSNEEIKEKLPNELVVFKVIKNIEDYTLEEVK